MGGTLVTAMNTKGQVTATTGLQQEQGLLGVGTGACGPRGVVPGSCSSLDMCWAGDWAPQWGCQATGTAGAQLGRLWGSWKWTPPGLQ